MKSCLALVFAFSFLFIGVNVSAQKNKEVFTSYFKSNIEYENFKEPPQHLYKQNISLKNIEAAKKEVWEAWKDANQERLATFYGDDLQSGKDSIVWTLPQGYKTLVTLIKKGNTSNGKNPFYINLHGGGAMGNVPSAWGSPMNAREWEAAKRLGRMYNDSPSVYFVPRYADDRNSRWGHSYMQTAWIRAWQLVVLSNDADPDKTYILGISEGGYGSFRMGAFFADYFAGMGPMAGTELPAEAAIENLRNIASRIEVGELDKMFGRDSLGRVWKKLLDSASNAAGNGQFNHEVVIQKEMGHGIDYMNVAPWLRKFSRNVYPDTLSFRFYQQYGTYRSGFAYTRLTGLSKTGERNFSIVKNGNTYRIKTENRKDKVTGSVDLYFDKIDFNKPVTVYLNGKKVFANKVKPNYGVLAESISLFGDPGRMFTAKTTIKIDE